MKSLNTERELHTNIDIARNLDQLRELHRLLSSVLQIINSEDLKPRFIDLFTKTY